MFVLQCIDCGNHNIMILSSFGEFELLQTSLPTHKTKQVIRINEKVEKSFSFWQENVLQMSSDSCFEFSVRHILN